MPRITKATRTSLPINSNQYDLNTDFRDYINGQKYSSEKSLILWSDFASPGGLSVVPGYDLVGSNQSDNYSDDRHKLYSLSGVGLDSSRNVFDDFCGSKHYFYLSANRAAAPGTGYTYQSTKDFIILDHDDLTFSSGGNDKPFTVNFWVYPKEVGGFSINDGGSDVSGNLIPTFFEKQNEYHLRIDPNGRLRMTLLSAGSSSNFIYTESNTNVFVANEWNQITITYNASGAAAGIKIYRNGVDVTDTSRGNLTGTYSSMSNSSKNFIFGAGPTTRTSMPSAHISGIGPTVFIAELSIWSSELSTEEVSAVYHATLTCAATGFTRESGYISEPPRIRLRRLDSLTGSYPTIKRTGDRDFRGDFKVKFNDTNTQIFGEKIVDEFTNIKPREPFSKRIDSNKWVFTPGLEIRRESLPGINGATFQDGVLVFNGSGERSIRTKQKLRNTSIYFELIQGPHNLVTNILGEGLRLEKPSLSEKLKVEFSTDDGVSWTTIREYTPQPVQLFYDLVGKSGVKEETDPVTGNLLSVRTRYRKRIDIHFTEIPAGDKEYYLRFVQENSDRADKSVWGIGRIEITSMNQELRYPLLVSDTSLAGKSVIEKSIMTPHTRSDITAVGRSIPHTSDHFIHFTPGENLSPFKEDLAVEILDPTNLFHAIGTDPLVGLPGYSSRLADKTKITIDLGIDASNPVTKIGHTGNSSTADPNDVNPNELGVTTSVINPFTYEIISTTYNYRHDLMCLYDNKNKGWLPKSFPPIISSLHTIEEFVEDHAHLGFGPTDIIASRSAGASLTSTTIVEQYDSDVISNYVRPVKTYGFPFSEKYEMASDETVLMSDYINKPFVLEKVIVEFDAAFEFAPNDSFGENSYGLHQSYNDTHPSDRPSQRRSINQHRVIIPTFFILNQFNDAYETFIPLKGEVTERENYNLSYSSDHRSRELVTYGQICLFASSSQSDQLDLEAALDAGLKRDLNVNILRLTGQESVDITTGSINSFTSSFRLEFPCRTSPKTGFNQRILLKSSSLGSAQNVGLFMSDYSGGRNYESLERGSRGLINNFPGINPGKSYKTFSVNQANDPIEVNSVSQEAIDVASPYVLFPGDELIFGWQYPINLSYSQFTNGSGDTGHKNLMQLIGNTRVHLYGSLVSDGKEYHEYSNAPLSSDAIHEVIGAEKPIDKFQIFTRGELSGSYVDRWVYFEEIWDHATEEDIKVFSDAPENPLERIGSPVFSISSSERKLRSDILSLYSSLPIFDQILRTGITLKIMASLGERDQVQRFVRARDSNNFYLDSLYNSGSIFPGSTYGTQQTYFVLDTGGYSSEYSSRRTYGAIVRNPGRPKHYFSHKHFGHLSDYLQQGRDSKMWKYVGPTSSPAPGTLLTGEEADATDTSDTNTHPVVVQFVSGTNTQDSRLRIYRHASFHTLVALSSNPERHAMYNSSIYSTSSVPYLDNERTEIFTENIR